MRILLTNDDGVYAPGLAALYEALVQDHQVTVTAPETEQSAVGHAITLADPIRVRVLGPRSGLKGFAVTGTPADCVKLAVNELMDQPPDLVLSGVNLGANVGVNILYSGTVSAATEAALLGIAGAAVSLDALERADFRFAARFMAHLAASLPSLDLPPGTPLNVNVPALPPDAIRGVRFTSQSQARIREKFIRRTGPRGHVYYWLGGETMADEGDLSLDYPALKAGYISITPLSCGLTRHEVLAGLASRTLDLP
jgi:5'-nucleotidase